MTNKYIEKNRDNAQRDWTAQLVVDAQRKKWYGKITVVMEEGVIRRVVKEESIKPPQ